MSMDGWLALIPAGVIVFGIAGYVWVRRESAMLDRRFGPDRG